jgi:alkylation response protein AidB-like acyl-CoA dehydrogenase
MDFQDGPEQAAFRAEARKFLTAHWPLRGVSSEATSSQPWDSSEAIAASRAWQAKRFEEGWAVLAWPEEYGGRDLGAIEQIIFDQEQACFDAPHPDPFLMGLGMLGPTILVHGTDEQKQRFLSPLARGDEIWVQLFSEPSAGSDLAAVRTTATRDGAHWILEGQKVWTSAAHIANFGMCVARTDPTVPKHDGLTVFIVDLRRPGIEVRPIRQISGEAEFNEVYLNGVRIADDCRLGGVGEGWKVVTTCLMHERVSLDGLWTPGVERLIELARNVEIEGRPALDDSSVRERIADFHVLQAGVERFGARSITTLARGGTPGPENALSKLVLGRLGQEIAAFAVELQGMAGGEMDPEFGFQWGYLRSPSLRLAGGTDEILRNVLAERVLRLPKEPRMGAGVPFQDLPRGPRRARS